MRYRTRSAYMALCVVLFACISVLPSGAVTGQDPGTITPEGLAGIWKHRAESVRSGRFSWTVTRWIRKGSLAGDAVAPGVLAQLGQPFPTDDTTLTLSHTLVFDGSLIRHECRGPTFDPRAHSFRDEHFVSVWNGMESKVFRGGHEVPWGQVHDFSWEPAQPELRAFQYAFRMHDPQWFTLEPSEHVIADRKAVINGVRCIRLETAPAVLAKLSQNGGRAWKASYWSSPDRGYAVVKYTLTWQDLTNADTTIRYRHDPEHGWYPVRWTQVMESHREPVRIDDATVTSYALNVPIDAGEFEFTFPDGTVVTDSRSQEHYLARAVGKRMITPAELERGATYQSLLETEEGMAGRTVPVARRSRLFIVLAFGLIVAAVCCLGVWLRKTRSDDSH